MTLIMKIRINNILTFVLVTWLIFIFIKCGSLKNLGYDKPMITTDTEDSKMEIPFLDDYNPNYYQPISIFLRDNEGKFKISQPGNYEYQAESYCISPGKYGPDDNIGYAIAQTKGPRADIIDKIVNSTYLYPEVNQEQYQLLIWAVISKTKLLEMSDEISSLAIMILTEEEISEINGGALGNIPEPLKVKIIDELPEEVIRIIEIEEDLRDALTEANATYEEIEEIAVLEGDLEEISEEVKIPKGRWSLGSNGIFSRYEFEDYQKVKVQISLPYEINITKDLDGRITILEDTIEQHSIIIDYGLNTPTVIGYPNDSIRFTKYNSLKLVKSISFMPEEFYSDTIKIKDEGWLIQGLAQEDDLNVLLNGEELADNYRERVEIIRQHFDEIKQLDNNFNSSKQKNELIDVSNLILSLGEISDFNDSHKKIRFEQGKNFLMMAWQKKLIDRFSPNKFKEVPIFPESTISLVPGFESYQVQKVSPRTFDDNPCAFLGDVFREQTALLKAFQDEGLKNEAKRRVMEEYPEWVDDNHLKAYKNVVSKFADYLYNNDEYFADDYNIDYNDLPQRDKNEIFNLSGAGSSNGEIGRVGAAVLPFPCRMIPNKQTLKSNLQNKYPNSWKIIYDMTIAHENVHMDQCQNRLSTFIKNEIDVRSDFEVEAYLAGIQVLLNLFNETCSQN